MPLKHSTIPAGTDQPGFAGVTPSIWAQQHTFSGGTQGSVLTYNTGSSDNLSFTQSLAGLLLSTGTNVLPTFTSTINVALTFSSINSFTVQQLFAPGTALLPGIAQTANAATGFWFPDANQISTSLNGNDIYRFSGSTASGFETRSDYPFSWSSTTAAGGTADTLIYRDGAAGTMALRNSTNAQTFRIYNTFTDTSNYERGFMRWNANFLEVGTEKAGTGAVRSLRLTALGATSAALIFATNSTDRWQIEGTNGNILAITDNATDIGASGASRPRDLFLGRNLGMPGVATISNDSAVSLIIGTGTAASIASARINGGTNAGTGPSLRFATNGTDQVFVGTVAGVIGSGTSAGLALFSKADIQFYTNNSNTSKMGLDTSGILTQPTDVVRGYILGSGAATAVPSIRINGGTNATAGAAISFARNGTDKVFVGTSSYINGAGGDQAAFFGAADIGFYTNNSSNAKFGINTNGDWTIGTSSHVMDSGGAPTISSAWTNGQTITGNDYAFQVVITAGAAALTGTLNFGHTWSTAPVCVGMINAATQLLSIVTTTTQITISSNASMAGETVYTLCRGF